MKVLHILIVLYLLPITLLAQNPFDQEKSLKLSSSDSFGFKSDSIAFNSLVKGNQKPTVMVNGISLESNLRCSKPLNQNLNQNNTKTDFSLYKKDNGLRQMTFKQTFPAYKDPTKRWHYKFVDNCD
ncbi:hypothetical protein [Mangrovimonas cancribranchiae]|uniref:Uncharacterized protein n=1 Tax=Mangrovimonas cancribranchiae TaxID=3080055 RepID=A0AAU6P7F4_9FLAO